MGLWTDEPEMLGGSNKRTGPQGGVRQTITIATRTREALRLRGDVAQATSVRPACLSSLTRALPPSPGTTGA